MEHDILSLMSGGDTTLAWLGAVALAAGGTAVVVGLYLQLRRWRTAPPTRTAMRRKPAPSAPAVSKPTNEPNVPPLVGVAAYRAEQGRSAESPSQPSAAEVPDLEAQDALLQRLRKAAESLEEIALRSGRAAGGSEAYQSFLTGLDVEYLHRQN